MSPRPKSDRRYVGVRLHRSGYDVIEQMAEQERVSLSDMIRTLLREAVQARQGKARPSTRAE